MTLFRDSNDLGGLSVCYCTGRCENGTKTCSREELPKDRELRLLRAAVKEVLAIHKPYADDPYYCDSCNDEDEMAVEYPCPTVAAIASALGERP